jgi:hypothetical protein
MGSEGGERGRGALALHTVALCERAKRAAFAIDGVREERERTKDKRSLNEWYKKRNNKKRGRKRKEEDKGNILYPTLNNMFNATTKVYHSRALHPHGKKNKKSTKKGE